MGLNCSSCPAVKILSYDDPVKSVLVCQLTPNTLLDPLSQNPEDHQGYAVIDSNKYLYLVLRNSGIPDWCPGRPKVSLSTF